MAAANTDKFKKLSRKWVGQIGAGGVADASTTTIPLSSATNLPTDTAVVAVINRVDANGKKTPSLEETIIGVVSGSDLIDCVRGAEGTAQPHSAGSVIETLVTAKGWNDLIDGLLVSHSQDGTLKSGLALTLPQINDTSSDHQYIYSVCELTADRTVQLPLLTGNDEFLFKAHAAVMSNKSHNGDFNLSNTTDNVTVSGVDPYRTVSIFGGMKPTTTAGCAEKETIEAGTNDIDYDVLAFDASSDENAFVNFAMPDSYDGGVVQFRYVWTNAGGGAAETVVFELSGRSLADDEAIDQAVGTPVELSDTWIAQNDIHISAWSGDVTLAGTPAGGEWVHFEIMRDVSEDNLTGDARLIDVQIRYRQKRYSD